VTDPAAPLRGYDLRPRSAAELLDAAFAVMRSDPKAVVLLAVGPSFATSIADLLRPVAGDDEDELMLGLAVELTAAVAYSLVIALPTFALTRLWASRLLGSAPTLGSATGDALRRAPAVLFSTLVAAVLLMLGLGLGLLPGIYVTLAFLLNQPVLAFEPIGGLPSLWRSRELMAGSKLRLLLPTLVPYFSAFVLFLPLGTYGEIASAAIAGILTAYLSALAFVAYVDVRCRKEAFDLEVLAARVEAGPR
jgi:hypothetical protein